MANPLAQLLASAIMPQSPPQGGVPPGLPDLMSRSRFPPNMMPPMAPLNSGLSPTLESGEYAPLVDPSRSRFPPGMLEALGLGAARVK